jgi:hypothetical protein
MKASDTHWILGTENRKWRSIKGWRRFLAERAGASARGHIDALSPELLLFVGWHVRRAEIAPRGGREYKQFLRAVGGAGDADWYKAKAEHESESDAPAGPARKAAAKPSPPRKFKEMDIMTWSHADEKREAAEFLSSLEALANGDLGDYREDFERFLEDRRKKHEHLEANPDTRKILDEL